MDTAKLPKGKVRVTYIISEKIATRVAVKAARERKRLSFIVETVLAKGLEKKTAESKASA